MAPDPDKIKSLPVVQAAEFLQWLHDGEPFEICIIAPLKPTSPLWEGRAVGKSTVAGWFVDATQAAKLACQVDAKGVYVTLNPTKDELLARANCRFKAGVDRTADKGIAHLRNLLIDIDPKRESGISSTDEEHERSLMVAQEISTELAKQFWPDPLYGDSGNGAHLIYPIALPNDPPGKDDNKKLIQKVLQAVAFKFSKLLQETNMDMDLTVFNPARLTKLYGTWTRKGENIPARPHRQAKILSLPPRTVLSLEKLQEMAQQAPEDKKGADHNNITSDMMNVEAYLTHYGREIIKIKKHGSGHLYCLDECVFDPSHNSNEAAIGQQGDGKLYYQCFHNSCKGRSWAEARHIISGRDKLTRFLPAAAASFYTPPKGGEQEHINKNSFSLGSDLKKRIEASLRAGDLTPQEVDHVIDILKGFPKNKSLTEEVEEWIMTSNGLFLTSDVHKELHLTSRDLKKQANEVCRRLAEKGRITPCGNKRGCYRVIEESEEMDWRSADIENYYPIKWPFELESLVRVFPGNIVVIAGEKNAGKSAFIYNLIKLNQDRHKIVLFNSEASREELKLRLSLHDDIRLDDWKFKPLKRSRDFSDGIFPNRLNIIDYFEFNDEARFYDIATEIRKIHDKLKKGICVIALQKKKGAEYGRGGDFSREKARMYLTMGGNKLKIVDGKIWASEKNPNGLEFDYKLVGGWKFIEWQ
jgi:hypothetical protein